MLFYLYYRNKVFQIQFVNLTVWLILLKKKHFVSLEIGLKNYKLLHNKLKSPSFDDEYQTRISSRQCMSMNTTITYVFATPLTKAIQCFALIIFFFQFHKKINPPVKSIHNGTAQNNWCNFFKRNALQILAYYMGRFLFENKAVCGSYISLIFSFIETVSNLNTSRKP